MRRVSSDMQDHQDNNTKLPEENDGRRTRLRTLIQWLFVCCRFFNQLSIEYSSNIKMIERCPAGDVEMFLLIFFRVIPDLSRGNVKMGNI